MSTSPPPQFRHPCPEPDTPDKIRSHERPTRHCGKHLHGDMPLSPHLLLPAQVREWVLDAAVRSARVDGGPAGGECLLLGLEDGVVLQVFVNNAFPLELVKASAAVVSCAMSLHRKKARAIAVIAYSAAMTLGSRWEVVMRVLLFIYIPAVARYMRRGTPRQTCYRLPPSPCLRSVAE